MGDCARQLVNLNHGQPESKMQSAVERSPLVLAGGLRIDVSDIVVVHSLDANATQSDFIEFNVVNPLHVRRQPRHPDRVESRQQFRVAVPAAGFERKRPGLQQ